jgi:hypothetical protein
VWREPSLDLVDMFDPNSIETADALEVDIGKNIGIDNLSYVKGLT